MADGQRGAVERFVDAAVLAALAFKQAEIEHELDGRVQVFDAEDEAVWADDVHLGGLLPDAGLCGGAGFIGADA